MCLAGVPRGYARKQREGHALGIAMPEVVNSESVERQHNLEEKQEISAASVHGIKRVCRIGSKSNQPGSDSSSFSSILFSFSTVYYSTDVRHSTRLQCQHEALH